MATELKNCPKCSYEIPLSSESCINFGYKFSGTEKKMSEEESKTNRNVNRAKKEITQVPLWRIVIGIIILFPGIHLTRKLGTFIWAIMETLKGDPVELIHLALGLVGVFIIFIGLLIIGPRGRNPAIIVIGFLICSGCTLTIFYFFATIPIGVLNLPKRYQKVDSLMGI